MKARDRRFLFGPGETMADALAELRPYYAREVGPPLEGLRATGWGYEPSVPVWLERSGWRR